MHKITKDDINFCDTYTRKICRRYGRVADDDAIQTGREGMVLAAHKFDERFMYHEKSFQGYAAYQIRVFVKRNYLGFDRGADPIKNGVEYSESIGYMNNSDKTDIVKTITANDILNNLKDDYRYIAIRSLIDGASNIEISKELGCSHQNIEQKLSRIIKNTRKRFRKEIHNGEM